VAGARVDYLRLSRKLTRARIEFRARASVNPTTFGPGASYPRQAVAAAQAAVLPPWDRLFQILRRRESGANSDGHLLAELRNDNERGKTMTTSERRSRSDAAGTRMEEAGEQVTGAHDETRWSLLTTEFWAMMILAGVLLLAAAISDSFDDNRAWTLVTIVGAAYILSRGLAKSGTGHTPFLRRGRRV
jgi:hypothetical protein